MSNTQNASDTMETTATAVATDTTDTAQITPESHSLHTSRQLWADGLWHANPALVKLLGLCPLLAVSNTTINAFALGIATTLTLIVTNLSVSLLRENIPQAIRLPIYVLIIATSVTCIELVIQAWLPALHDALGIFLPLIVTNCLIIGRAEAFASRQNLSHAGTDALAMGFGFTWVLVALGTLRELIGQGTLLADAHLLFGPQARDWSLTMIPGDYSVLIALLPPGAFLLLGLLLALKNLIDQTRSNT